jgi:hypothetical protein
MTRQRRPVKRNHPIITCRDCKRLAQLAGRGRCGTCYVRWWRKQKYGCCGKCGRVLNDAGPICGKCRPRLPAPNIKLRAVIDKQEQFFEELENRAVQSARERWWPYGGPNNI